MITRSMPRFVVREASAVETFQAGLRGELIMPGHPDYASARRVWNGMVDKYPAMIVRCAGAADVVGAIRFARSAGLQISVRGGGHNAAGNAVVDGGLVIDLSQMKDIRVNPLRLTARAEPGVTLGELVAATQAYGLATTTGTVSGTGMAGLTLGGGMGWLMGTYGLTIDNLLAVEIVTADGEVRHASADEHGDLFWAVRGGGGNFGVVTAFEYRLHPVDQVLAGMIVHPIERAEEMLRFYRDFTHAAPDELTVYAAITSAPDGQPVAAMVACYHGPFEEGERVLAPLRAFGPPLVNLIRPMSYLELVHILDAGAPDGRRYYEKGNSLPELTDEAIATIADFGAMRTSPFSQALIQHIHGVAARVDPAATAAHTLRGEQYVLGMIAAWDDGDDETHIAWSRAFWKETRPFAKEGVYVNFMNDDSAERVRAAYGSNYARLAAIKSKYDPENVFRLNQNIAPAAK